MTAKEIEQLLREHAERSPTTAVYLLGPDNGTLGTYDPPRPPKPDDVVTVILVSDDEPTGGGPAPEGAHD